ncbi:hypothetical protein [Corallococcus sp. AB049A]|uniref:hypothetical protein n=1 Tax=Corallococcus sp. AB049A TaxID=2316721 RepID=UPI0018F28B10|nr:hypothetical protein [Corallococcus sp. AB049A]
MPEDAPFALVVFASSTHLGDEGLGLGHGDHLWGSAGLRIPFVVRMPGQVASGREVTQRARSLVEVHLAEWPIRLYSRWERWTDYAEHSYREGLTGEALKAADTAMAAARQVAPDLDVLRALRERMLLTSH